MRKILLIAFAGILFAMHSCQHKGDFDNKGDFETILTPADRQVVVNDCGSIGYMLITDSVLWFSDEDGDNLVHVYNLSGSPIASGINTGQGRDEVLELSSLRQINGDAYLYDSRGGTLAEIMCMDKALKPARVYGNVRLYDDVVLLPDSFVLVLPLNSANSYVILDKHQNKTDSLSYFPPKPDDVDDATHYLACTGNLAYSPTDTTFVRTVVYDGGIDFFSVENGRIRHNARYANFNMEYTTVGNEIRLPVPSEESKVGYAYVYATPEYFYAMFSDDRCLDNDNALGREIHVFDHQGEPQHKIILTNPISSFAVSDDNKLIFVAEYEPNSICDNVIRYNLPSVN